MTASEINEKYSVLKRLNEVTDLCFDATVLTFVNSLILIITDNNLGGVEYAKFIVYIFLLAVDMIYVHASKIDSIVKKVLYVSFIIMFTTKIFNLLVANSGYCFAMSIILSLGFLIGNCKEYCKYSSTCKILSYIVMILVMLTTFISLFNSNEFLSLAGLTISGVICCITSLYYDSVIRRTKITVRDKNNKNRIIEGKDILGSVEVVDNYVIIERGSKFDCNNNDIKFYMSERDW